MPLKMLGTRVATQPARLAGPSATTKRVRGRKSAGHPFAPLPREPASAFAASPKGSPGCGPSWTTSPPWSTAGVTTDLGKGYVMSVTSRRQPRT